MAKASLQGFKDFILRGNVIDLAVAVAVGAAFTAVVQALAVDFFGSVIAAIGGVPDLSEIGIPVRDLDGDGTREVVLSIGPFLAALLNFLIVAAVLYFFVVTPLNGFLERRRAGVAPPIKATPEDIALLQEIRDLLKAQAVAGGSATPLPSTASPTAAPPGTAPPTPGGKTL